VRDELDKLHDQILKVGGSYIKIAKDMKADKLADAIDFLLRMVPTSIV
jgi:hypothetical protein